MLKDRVRPLPNSIREMVERRPGSAGREEGSGDESPLSFDKLTPLPKPGDPYKAHQRPENQMQPTLHFLLGNGTVRGFSFHNLDSIDLVPADQPGDGLVIVLRFAGIVGVEARISGRKLDALHMLLGHHRVGWVRELPPGRDFLAADEPVITRVTVRLVQEFPEIG
jgi:hypothetical protein